MSTIQNDHSSDVSRLSFVEKDSWKKGQEIITVYIEIAKGRHRAVAHIYLDCEEDLKPIYIPCDSKGREVFPASDNLEELKMQFQEDEERFVLMAQAKERRVSFER